MIKKTQTKKHNFRSTEYSFMLLNFFLCSLFKLFAVKNIVYCKL